MFIQGTKMCISTHCYLRPEYVEFSWQYEARDEIYVNQTKLHTKVVVVSKIHFEYISRFRKGRRY